jgi:hypothetical protein
MPVLNIAKASVTDFYACDSGFTRNNEIRVESCQELETLGTTDSRVAE